MLLRTRLLRRLARWFPPYHDQAVTPDGHATFGAHKAAETMGSYLAQLPTRDVDVLDFGCRGGGETFWLATQVRSVVGVDIDADALTAANQELARRGDTNCRFACSCQGRLPFPDASFDAVLSTDTFEHVMDLDRAFAEIARVLKPGGHLLSRWGQLFYSPYGYHLGWVCAVPWAHLWAGLRPIMELREATTGAPWYPATWRETGLNGQRYADFVRALRGAGFTLVRCDRIPVRGQRWLARLPAIGDLFTFGIDLHAITTAEERQRR